MNAPIHMLTNPHVITICLQSIKSKRLFNVNFAEKALGFKENYFYITKSYINATMKFCNFVLKNITFLPIKYAQFATAIMSYHTFLVSLICMMIFSLVIMTEENGSHVELSQSFNGSLDYIFPERRGNSSNSMYVRI